MNHKEIMSATEITSLRPHSRSITILSIPTSQDMISATVLKPRICMC